MSLPWTLVMFDFLTRECHLPPCEARRIPLRRAFHMLACARAMNPFGDGKGPDFYTHWLSQVVTALH